MLSFFAHPFNRLRQFINLETISGILLFIAAFSALLVCNSPLASLYYFLFNDYHFLAQPLHFWINDGLMTLFFIVVGLEIKREIINGELNTAQKRILPVLAALGGMFVPALIFTVINWKYPIALKGWAIPSATDIAFALGVFVLLGKRIPLGLKIFLMALAIIDDLGAVAIITLFYSSTLSFGYVILAAVCILGFWGLNKNNVQQLKWYCLLGVALWFCLHYSGIHPTVAGVVLSFFVPLHTKHISPLRRLEHILHPWVAFGIMPLFAFANAGISFASFNMQNLLSGIPAGIIAGLFIGKQSGIFLSSWIAVKLHLARLPEQVSWRMFYGMSIICGVGFTMSLFIGNLAYENLESALLDLLRVGVLSGSALSGLVGYFFLRLNSR